MGIEICGVVKIEDSNYVYLLLKKNFDGINYGKDIIIDLEYEERVWDVNNNDIIRVYAMSETDRLAELGAGAYAKIMTCSIDVESNDVGRYGKLLNKIKDIVDGANDVFETGEATQIYPADINKKGAYVDILTMDDVSGLSEGDYVKYILDGDFEYGWVYWIDDMEVYIYKFECEVYMKRIVAGTEHSNRLKRLYRKIFDIESYLYVPRS